MLHIMICDDSRSVRRMVAIVLRREGYLICGEAENGLLALSMIMEKKPDLVIMDINMPKLTGLEVIARVMERGLPTKFIILSAENDTITVREAVQLKPVDFMVKPLNTQRLLATIKRIFNIRDDEPKPVKAEAPPDTKQEE